MAKEVRLPCFISVCENCGEIIVLSKQGNVPSYCHICGKKTLYKDGYITRPRQSKGYKERIINELKQQSNDEKMFTLLNTKVDEVYETEDIQEVSERIKKSWILLGIANKRGTNPVYVLGHLGHLNLQEIL